MGYHTLGITFSFLCISAWIYNLLHNGSLVRVTSFCYVFCEPFVREPGRDLEEIQVSLSLVFYYDDDYVGRIKQKSWILESLPPLEISVFWSKRNQNLVPELAHPFLSHQSRLLALAAWAGDWLIKVDDFVILWPGNIVFSLSCSCYQ